MGVRLARVVVIVSVVKTQRNTMCKENNSQFCFSRGYKLSSIVPDITVSNNVTQINIGGDNDEDIIDSALDTAYRVKLFLRLILIMKVI